VIAVPVVASTYPYQMPSGITVLLPGMHPEPLGPSLWASTGGGKRPKSSSTYGPSVKGSVVVEVTATVVTVGSVVGGTVVVAAIVVVVAMVVVAAVVVVESAESSPHDPITRSRPRSGNRRRIGEPPAITLSLRRANRYSPKDPTF
jgi:hypothetical protein